METSILLAKIIGPILLVVGVGILINLEHYRALVAEFAASPFQLYVSGLMALLLGVLVVAFHNVWEWRWPLIVTLIGWASIIKGTVRIAAPGFVRGMAERYGRGTAAIAASAVAALALGAVLTYFAFFAAA
jgi:hypothetical protein